MPLSCQKPSLEIWHIGNFMFSKKIECHVARSRPGSRPCQTHFAKNENPWNSFRNGQSPKKEQCSVRNDQNPNREQAPVTLASRVATVTGACSLFRFWPFLRRQEGVCSDLYVSDVRYFALLSGSFRALFALAELLPRLPSSCRVEIPMLKFHYAKWIMKNIAIQWRIQNRKNQNPKKEHAAVPGPTRDGSVFPLWILIFSVLDASLNSNAFHDSFCIMKFEHRNFTCS